MQPHGRIRRWSRHHVPNANFGYAGRREKICVTLLVGCDLAAITVNLRRVIVCLYLVLFLSVSVASGLYFWDAREEYNRLKQIEATSRRRLAESEARLREQEKILDRLRNDPAYVEKVIRRRLGYAKPDEFVFRFEE